MPTTHYTLIFIKINGYVLLGYKKRGLGVRKWNGYGGKIEVNENVTDGVIRELYEESNLIVHKDNLKYLGVVTYNDRQHTRVVYIFTSSQFQGELKETEEMKPQWFTINNLPYNNMWPDSQFWVPLVINNQYFQASFTYINNELNDYNVERLSELPDMIF